MKIKSIFTATVMATALSVMIIPSQAAWSMHGKCIKSPGWHMVSKKCHIPAAANWQEYNSGIYTQPVGQPLIPLL